MFKTGLNETYVFTIICIAQYKVLAMAAPFTVARLIEARCVAQRSDRKAVTPPYL